MGYTCKVEALTDEEIFDRVSDDSFDQAITVQEVASPTSNACLFTNWSACLLKGYGISIQWHLLVDNSRLIRTGGRPTERNIYIPETRSLR